MQLPGRYAPRQNEQAVVAPWGKPPKPMVQPPCARPRHSPAGGMRPIPPHTAGLGAAYCGSLGAAGGGQLGAAAATQQAAACHNERRKHAPSAPLSMQTGIGREIFTAGHRRPAASGLVLNPRRTAPLTAGRKSAPHWPGR